MKTPHTPTTRNTRIVLSTAFGLLAATLFSCATARGQDCQVYPIALSLQTVANAAPGTILTNIWNGVQPGNFGWLSWTGDPGEPTLVDSLTSPGDSFTYVNPDYPIDHQLVAGKWVLGKPGVTNGKHVRAALNTLMSAQIVVPIWDLARGQGDTAAYHIVGFANVQILNYQLPVQNQITAVFLGFVGCGATTTWIPMRGQTLTELALN
jgi:hypothetical protein